MKNMLVTIQYRWDDLFKIYGGESLLRVQHDLLLHRFEVARIHFLLWLQRKNNIQSLYLSPTHSQSISSVQYFAVKAVEFSSPSLHQIFFVLRVKRSYFCSWWREVWYLEYHLGGSTGVCTGHCFLPAPQVGSRFGQMWPRQGLLVGVCGGGCDHCSDVSTQTAVDIIHS